MLYDVMNVLNNHFIVDSEFGDFSIVADGIVGDFDNVYLAGMYVVIDGSLLNDGIYKITGVTPTKITVLETLEAEDTELNFFVHSSAPPSGFLTIVTQISSYQERGLGVASERIDEYQVTYANGDGSWKSIYMTKLSPYRRVFSDLKFR